MSRRKRNKKKSSSSNAPQSKSPKQPATSDSPAGNVTSKDQAPAKPDRSTPSLSIAGLPSLSRVTSVIMLMVGILIVGLLFYKVMVGFFIPLFMAAALVVIFHPVHEWFLQKTNQRRRLSAGLTTSVILGIVLVPVLLLLFIAIGEFPGMISRAGALRNLQPAVESMRDRLGLKLEYPNQFRRLEELTGLFDDIQHPEVVLLEIDEASDFVRGLEQEVESNQPTEEIAQEALDALDEFRSTVNQLIALNEDSGDSAEEAKTKIEVEEKFHGDSVEAGAKIHSWINTKLGGSFLAQAKLLTNPSEKDVAMMVRSVRGFIQPRFFKATNDIGAILLRVVIGMVIMVISIYFFFMDGPKMVRTLMRLSPLDDAYELRLLGEFEKTSRAVVLASLLSALMQGILAALAFWWFGLQSIILLFIVTTVMALIPFLGAASVWIPCALYIGAVEQRYAAAIMLAIWGALVVSSIDNVIKAYVLQGNSELHPLIALLSVLGGVPVFGPIGILIGPMVVVFLQTLLEILNHELRLGLDDSANDSTAEPPSDQTPNAAEALNQNVDGAADAGLSPANG